MAEVNDESKPEVSSKAPLCNLDSQSSGGAASVDIPSFSEVRPIAPAHKDIFMRALDDEGPARAPVAESDRTGDRATGARMWVDQPPESM